MAGRARDCIARAIAHADRTSRLASSARVARLGKPRRDRAVIIGTLAIATVAHEFGRGLPVEVVDGSLFLAFERADERSWTGGAFIGGGAHDACDALGILSTTLLSIRRSAFVEA